MTPWIEDTWVDETADLAERESFWRTQGASFRDLEQRSADDAGRRLYADLALDAEIRAEAIKRERETVGH